MRTRQRRTATAAVVVVDFKTPRRDAAISPPRDTKSGVHPCRYHPGQPLSPGCKVHRAEKREKCEIATQRANAIPGGQPPTAVPLAGARLRSPSLAVSDPSRGTPGLLLLCSSTAAAPSPSAALVRLLLVGSAVASGHANASKKLQPTPVTQQPREHSLCSLLHGRERPKYPRDPLGGVMLVARAGGSAGFPRPNSGYAKLSGTLTPLPAATATNSPLSSWSFSHHRRQWFIMDSPASRTPRREGEGWTMVGMAEVKPAKDVYTFTPLSRTILKIENRAASPTTLALIITSARAERVLEKAWCGLRFP